MDIAKELRELQERLCTSNKEYYDKANYVWWKDVLLIQILEKLNERQQQHASLIIKHEHGAPQEELKPCPSCLRLNTMCLNLIEVVKSYQEEAWNREKRSNA